MTVTGGGQKRQPRFQFREVNSSTWAIPGCYITHLSIQTYGQMNESRLFSRSSGISGGWGGGDLSGRRVVIMSITLTDVQTKPVRPVQMKNPSHPLSALRPTFSDHIAADRRLLGVTGESSTGLRGFPLLSVAVFTFCSNFPGSGDATADV